MHLCPIRCQVIASDLAAGRVEDPVAGRIEPDVRRAGYVDEPEADARWHIKQFNDSLSIVLRQHRETSVIWRPADATSPHEHAAKLHLPHQTAAPLQKNDARVRTCHITQSASEVSNLFTVAT